LLSDVSFKPTYRTVHRVPVLQAGLSPMNTSFAQTSWFNEIAVDFFWFYFPALLSDGKISHSVFPVSCESGPSCEGYFLPGPTSVIHFDPTSPNITEALFPEASTFIQYDAPGYQIDFHPIDENDPVMIIGDCHVYGLPGLALQLCLKQSNLSLITGNVSLNSADSSLEFMSNVLRNQRPVSQHNRMANKRPLQHKNDNLKTKSNNNLQPLKLYNPRYHRSLSTYSRNIYSIRSLPLLRYYIQRQLNTNKLAVLNSILSSIFSGKISSEKPR
jgi:hypothetical protein